MTDVSIAAPNPGFEAPGPRDFQLRDVFFGDQLLLTKAALLLVLAAVIAISFSPYASATVEEARVLSANGVLVVAMYLPIFHLGDAISGMGG